MDVLPLANSVPEVPLSSDFHRKRIQLVIIDEHPAVRQALVVRLESAPGVEVVSVDTSLQEALPRIRQLRPEVILLGLRTTRRLSPYLMSHIIAELAGLGAGVIALTSFVDVVERDMLLQAGARRYLLKNIDSSRLLAEIEATAGECREANAGVP